MRIFMTPETRIVKGVEASALIQLRPRRMRAYSRRVCFLAAAAVLALSVGCKKSEQTAVEPKTFASPEDASKAVYNAAKAGDSNALVMIFGADSKDLLFSGDA